MAGKIWLPGDQAFAESAGKKIWNATQQAFEDSYGKVWNQIEQAWEERWSPDKKLYLYNYGDECTNITGGWTADGYSVYYNGVQTLFPGEKSSDHMTMQRPSGIGSTQSRSLLGTANKIDLSGYSKLGFIGRFTTVNGSGNTIETEITKQINLLSSTSKAIIRNSSNLDYTSTPLIVDIGNEHKDQPKYIYIAAGPDSGKIITVYSMWLEK